MKSWMMVTGLCLLAQMAVASEPVVEAAGIGKYRIGTARAAVEKLDKFMRYHDQPDMFPASECSGATPSLQGLSLMFVDNRLARIYIDQPTFVTASGLHIGSPLTDVYRVYGDNLKKIPHPDMDNWWNLYAIEQNGHGILFTTDGKIVQEMSVGTFDALQASEGCL